MGYTKTRFTLFDAWFSVNEDNCTVEEKGEILGSFNYRDFTGEELVKVVGRSGLFSREEAEEMVIERLRHCEERQCDDLKHYFILFIYLLISQSGQLALSRDLLLKYCVVKFSDKTCRQGVDGSTQPHK